ncbi:ATP-binding protein [Amycolatopsis benzoatilytica]|uniref:ATP-binding protein n=1 Tax=Amycolatopsis benzoatilytica TaxID=346045 RepID=UPI0003A4754E|nr:ATP-binding protein [Amycolatopsis benzoatilytica]
MAGLGAATSGPPWEFDLRETGVSALPRIRAWAGRLLPQLSPADLADVLMVVEELASNAYEHTPGPRCARLTARGRPCQVVVEVDDPVLVRPRLRPPDPARTRGRGMLLVDRLSDAWGVRERPDGKTVWACLGFGAR